jgi:hypothetical protein
MPTSVPALLPLAVFEAVQNIDTPADDGLGALQDELAAKRLGLSPTVAAQVARYREQANAGGEVSEEEALGVFRLVGRRPDAALVFADAGRRAARHAARRLSTARRAIIAAAPGRLGETQALRSACQLSRRWLLADLRLADMQLRCELLDSLAFRARDDGTGCHFYTAAFAELVRQVGGLEWTVSHDTCRGQGDPRCVWLAQRAEGYE